MSAEIDMALAQKIKLLRLSNRGQQGGEKEEEEEEEVVVVVVVVVVVQHVL